MKKYLMPLNCVLEIFKMKKKIVLCISYHNKNNSPPNVAKLKARKENTQVPELKTDLGAGGRC